jgi:hypothetical protein
MIHGVHLTTAHFMRALTAAEAPLRAWTVTK